MLTRSVPVVYTTLTELCPVTETKVVGGSTVEVTWTSTSTVVKEVKATQTVFTTSVATRVTKVDLTQTVYTTSVATEVEKTNVYTTVCPTTLPQTQPRILTHPQVTCPETTYTTVVAGSTIKVTKTDT